MAFVKWTCPLIHDTPLFGTDLLGMVSISGALAPLGLDWTRKSLSGASTGADDTAETGLVNPRTWKEKTAVR